jgi:hypothetical protein
LARSRNVARRRQVRVDGTREETACARREHARADGLPEVMACARREHTRAENGSRRILLIPIEAPMARENPSPPVMLRAVLWPEASLSLRKRLGSQSVVCDEADRNPRVLHRHSIVDVGILRPQNGLRMTGRKCNRCFESFSLRFHVARKAKLHCPIWLSSITSTPGGGEK